MFEKLGHCPLCEGSDIQNDRIVTDYSITKEEFALSKCLTCGFLFTNPRPTEDHLSKYYQSSEYISHQNKTHTLINKVYSIARKYTLKWKLNLISRYVEKGKLLDIGCGTGHFLQTMQKAGWQTWGVEPDATARKMAKQLVGNNLVHNDLNALPQKKFDVITLWHVLEHISELNHQLNQIKQLLIRRGRLFIAVPNHKSFDADYYQNFWAGYDVPRHLYHFDKDTMSKVSKKIGLKIVDVLPMKLDAYYVSLLSEKYKGSGPYRYLKSITTGYKSNSYAKKTGNYSSLIFVIKIK
ncbi:MAG: class I SAM-dependent methyltransferase [Bacteroidota bacterium]